MTTDEFVPDPHETQQVLDTPSTLRDRLVLTWIRATDRINLGVATAYLGAVSLIGLEGLAVVLTFSSLWPVGIPLIVGGLAVIYFTRERIRAIWHRLRTRKRSR